MYFNLTTFVAEIFDIACSFLTLSMDKKYRLYTVVVFIKSLSYVVPFCAYYQKECYFYCFSRKGQAKVLRQYTDLPSVILFFQCEFNTFLSFVFLLGLSHKQLAPRFTELL